MKARNPITRFDLKIPVGAKVLDVGSGHSPHPQASVITDKYTADNYHRASDIKILKHQKFVQASGESLPFKDKEFGYVICCHVVEHVDDPAAFLNELGRVGKAGYLEAPSLLGEFLVPKESHQWVLLEIENKLIIVNKKRLGIINGHGFGEVFLEYLPASSIGFKVLQRTHQQLLAVKYEWKESIDYIVDPTDERLLQFFNRPWDVEMCQKVFPKRSLGKEYLTAMVAGFDILKNVFKSRVLGKS